VENIRFLEVTVPLPCSCFVKIALQKWDLRIVRRSKNIMELFWTSTE
jgi:hypothetical protein